VCSMDGREAVGKGARDAREGERDGSGRPERGSPRPPAAAYEEDVARDLGGRCVHAMAAERYL